jgi:hypothetical protein
MKNICALSGNNVVKLLFSSINSSSSASSNNNLTERVLWSVSNFALDADQETNAQILAFTSTIIVPHFIMPQPSQNDTDSFLLPLTSLALKIILILAQNRKCSY